MVRKESMLIAASAVLPLALLAFAYFSEGARRRAVMVLLLVAASASSVSLLSKAVIEKRMAHNITLVAMVLNCLIVYTLFFLAKDMPRIFYPVYLVHALVVHVILVIRAVYYVRRARKLKARGRGVRIRRQGHRSTDTLRGVGIGVSDEVRVLRAKVSFVINNQVVIRKGESVQLLKTVGSYYSVRKFSGLEYIVPASYFY